jgi:hypothetical protein
MRTLAASVISTSLLLPVSVLADPPRPDAPDLRDVRNARTSSRDAAMAAGDCAVARKAGRTCVLDLPAEDIGGKTPAPGETELRILTLGTSGSLLRMRRDFIRDIVKAADDL